MRHGRKYQCVGKMQARELRRNKSNPLVSIVIANWNGKNLLEDCLSSIEKCTDYTNFMVIVVDNGSTDGSVTTVRKDFPWVKMIVNKANLGFARANNQGIRNALSEGADYILLLNNDTKVVFSDWLTKMIGVAEGCRRIGIVGCKLVYPDGRIQHAGGAITIKGSYHYGSGNPDDGTYDEIADVDYVTGASFLIKKEVVQKIGLLDEGFSPAYYEETDYCVRARIAGYRVVYNPRTTIVHQEGASAKRLEHKYVAFIRHKNWLRFRLLNFPLKWVPRGAKIELRFVISNFAEKKDETRRLSPLNFRLRNGWSSNLAVILWSYLENLKMIGEISRKRKNRLLKVWY